MEEDIQRIRREIDRTDNGILDLLADRSELVIRMRQAKNGQKIFKPSREVEIIRRVVKQNKSKFSDATIQAIFTEIVTGGRNLEERLRVAYLGPEGSYSHEAASRMLGSQSVFVPHARLSETLRAVDKDEADVAILPIENTTEGSVSETLRLLANTELTICGETSLPINHCLLGATKDYVAIKEIVAHPQALGQCRSWLEANIPHATLTPATSNSAAVKTTMNSPSSVAIAGEQAAKIYHVPILARGIQDNADNSTRFVILGRTATEATGKDKTTIICTAKDKPGALHELLGVFSAHKTNLQKLVSHPLPNSNYAFYIDFEGHQNEDDSQRLLRDLQLTAQSCKILGSYPKEIS